MSEAATPSRQNPARARAPEQVFFRDAAIDRLLGVVMALATEHYVLRQRVRALESAPSSAGRMDVGDSGGTGSDPRGPDAESDADAFVRSLLSPLLGLQESLGAEGLEPPLPARNRRGSAS